MPTGHYGTMASFEVVIVFSTKRTGNVSESGRMRSSMRLLSAGRRVVNDCVNLADIPCRFPKPANIEAKNDQGKNRVPKFAAHVPRFC